MSESLNTFIQWFNTLSAVQKTEILECTSNYIQQINRNNDGFFAGPLPIQGSNPCPTCGKPR
jgi:hypothetical protein